MLKKKIILSSFAIVLFVGMALILFKMKEVSNLKNSVSSSFSQADLSNAMNKKTDSNVKPVFSQAEVIDATNKKADPNVKPTFSQAEIDATVNAKVPAKK